MKIFLIGLPRSGRSTVAQALASHFQGQCIDAMSWIRSTFRAPHSTEHAHHYEDEYDRFLSIRRLVNPNLISGHVDDLMLAHPHNKVFVIDGINSPKDFANLFDYRKDVVVFLNRTDTDNDFKDHENIGISVIRDYCFWMASAGLILKERWLEYNFKIPGEDSDFVKELGSKNRVFIIRSIDRVIAHLIESVKTYVEV